MSLTLVSVVPLGAKPAPCAKAAPASSGSPPSAGKNGPRPASAGKSTGSSRPAPKLRSFADEAATTRPAAAATGSSSRFPVLSTARFAVPRAEAPQPPSARQLVDASNARAIKATNPVVNSPQALAGTGPRGRGPANLSCLSAPDVRLPPMGMSPFDWAALNGITISWDHSGTMNGAASPDTRHIILGSQLQSLPEPVLWYALYHEIGHVLGGHSERQPRPSPVRFEWEHDADRYAAQAVTVADASTDAGRKQQIAAWLNTLQADAEHEPGPKIAEALLETCATPHGNQLVPLRMAMPFQLPFPGISIVA